MTDSKKDNRKAVSHAIDLSRPHSKLYIITTTTAVPQEEFTKTDTLKTVEDCEKRGGEHGQYDKGPADVGTPMWQHRVAHGSTLFVTAFDRFVFTVGLGLRLAEAINYDEDRRQNNETAKDTVADLLRGESDWSEGDCF